MADENIGSSPGKGKRSIHRSRLGRKMKRFCPSNNIKTELLGYRGTTISENTDPNEEDHNSCTLLIMYDSAEEENKMDENEKNMEISGCHQKLFEVDSDFDPFFDQRLLVLADRFGQQPNSSVNIVATHGFQPCIDLKLQPQPKIARPVEKCVGVEDELGINEITDSELLQVCQETETKTHSNRAAIEKANTHVMHTPETPQSKKPKTIVELILDDFCSSPASPERQQSSEESIFHFRFDNKPLRTYSRRMHEIIPAAQNIASSAIGDDFLGSDSSSGLSVQEDHTQLTPPAAALEISDLHNSQKLCENLKNLSAYFTEFVKDDEGKQNSTPRCAENQIERDEAISSPGLAAKPVSQGAVKNGGSDRVALNALNPELPIQFDCQSSNSSLADEFHGFSSQEEDNCIVATNEKCDIKNEAHDVFNLEDDDEWNDECDLFANFDTQVALETAAASKVVKQHPNRIELIEEFTSPHTKLVEGQIFVGFQTASKKTVTISAEAQARAAKILQELPPLPVDDSCVDTTFDGNGLMDFPKVVRKTMSSVKHSQKLDTEFLSQVPDLLLEADKIKFSKLKPEERSILVDLKNGSSKSIMGQTEAPQRQREYNIAPTNSSLSSNIESNEVEDKASTTPQHMPQLLAFEEQFGIKVSTTSSLINADSFLGFRTASSKAINVSKEAQERAKLILQESTEFRALHFHENPEECLENIQFSEWPLEDEAQIKDRQSSNVVDKTIIANPPEFFTASNKSIAISESAKLRAAAIFDKLPELPFKSELKLIDTHALQNNGSYPTTELSDELIKREMAVVSEGSVCVQNADTISKRKRAVSDFKESPSPQKTSKLVCKSPNVSRGPLSHIQTSVTRSSLSELAIKTPPDYKINRCVISRKNILSLNKRNRSKVRSLQHSQETNNESKDVETPTRRSNASHTASITSDPKSPPDTPIPNLQEFFKSVSMNTSTPHPQTRQQTRMRTRASKCSDFEAAATTTPTDGPTLTRIDWDNENLNKSTSSLNVSRQSNSSCSNITYMQSNPTPEQRIERLRIYGNPPNVSPIYMSSTNNCRISGLRRRKLSNVNK